MRLALVLPRLCWPRHRGGALRPALNRNHPPKAIAGQSSRRGSLLVGLFPAPGEEFVDTRSLVVGDAAQDIGEPSLWVDAVELGGADQGVDRRCALAATIGAREQP